MALASTQQRNAAAMKIARIASADLTTFFRVSDAFFPLSRYTKN